MEEPIYIGLIDFDRDQNKEHGSEKIEMFYNHTFTADYQKVMHRLATSVELIDVDNPSRVFKVGKALWDTGSMTSCISEKLAKKMGLRHEDVGVGITPAGQIDVFYYRLNVRISDDIIIPNVKVGAFPLEKHDVDFLIGMDIISKGDLYVENRTGKTVITFKFK